MSASKGLDDAYAAVGGFGHTGDNYSVSFRGFNGPPRRQSCRLVWPGDVIGLVHLYSMVFSPGYGTA